MIPEEQEKKGWAPLILIAVSTFLALFGTTVLNIAIAPLVVDLHTDIGTIQILIATYSLIMGSLMLFTGKLQDILGKRRAFFIGTSIFTVGSLVAAFSVNAATLFVGYSVLQGIGGGFLVGYIGDVDSGSGCCERDLNFHVPALKSEQRGLGEGITFPYFTITCPCIAG